MSAHLFYFAIDAVAVAFCALLAAALMVSNPTNRNAQLSAFICFNSLCYLMFSRYVYSPFIPEALQIDLGWLLVPARFAMNLTPGLFMVLAYSLFQDGRPIPRWALGAFLVQVLLEEPIPFLLSLNVDQGDPVFETLPALLQFLFIGLACYWTVKNWRSDLVEERRKLRLAYLLATGGLTILIVIIERVVFPFGVLSPFHTHVVLSGAVVIALVTALLFVARHGTGFLTDPGAPPPEPAKSEDLSAAAADLQTVRLAFDKRRIYREAGLTIPVLASTLQIPEYRLRKIIHQQMGYKNFRALLHEYRIREACERLTSPDEKRVPILTIALSVGYQSINPFNRAFKDLKGMTPSEFRAQSD